MKRQQNLPRSFRKLTINERRRTVAEYIGTDIDLITSRPLDYLELAGIMVENSVGVMGVPLGIAPGFLINGTCYDIPMATEEPSVIAAAAYSGGIISSAGGFKAEAGDSVMSFQIFFPLTAEFDLPAWLSEHMEEIEDLVKKDTASLAERGGGFSKSQIRFLEESKCVSIECFIDVCDAMGANRLNTAAETTAHYIKKQTGIEKIMAILSNAAELKRAASSFTISFSQIARAAPKGMSGEIFAQRIVTANAIAKEERSRAVTHNKGIMNGITALALATGNDTRAVESAVHAWASKQGSYTALTEYTIENGGLHARLDIPTPFATAGGAVQFHPTAEASLKILGNPDAKTLSTIAVSLGLAQNFAALMALTGKGIQSGHMKLHARKLAYQAGARGMMIDKTALELHRRGVYNIETARDILESMDEKE